MNNIYLFLKVLVIGHCLLLQISEGISSTPKDLDNIESVPFLVMIFADKNATNSGTFCCSGTLISEYDVITNAHCVANIDPSRLTVLGGATISSNSGVEAAVRLTIIPKAYNNKTLDMDVSVLKLKTSMSTINETFIKPVPLFSTLRRRSDNIQVYGWGHIDGNLILRAESLKYIDGRRCINSFGNEMHLTDVKFCAASSKNGTCIRNSGGPAIVNDQLVGVGSVTGCAADGTPDVFIHVGKVLDFIQNAMDYQDS